MHLFVDAGDRVACYVAEKTGHLMHDAHGLGAEGPSGELVGGVVFTNYTGFSVSISGAGRAIMTRSFRQAIGDYAFGFLGCRRMEIVTSTRNKRMKRLAPKLGFRFEGRLRRYYGDEDGLMYSMLSNEAVTLGHWTPHPVAVQEAA